MNLKDETLKMAPIKKNPPLQINIIRGPRRESFHFVHGVVYSDQITVFGDENFGVFPRSSIKPLQALPLLESGAFEHFQCSDEELALACASHRGEQIHTEKINSWLQRLGLNENQLECGCHPPTNPDALFKLYSQNNKATSIHNNCSGKHTGMLMTALFCKESLVGYTQFQHPVQQRIINAVEKFCGLKLSQNHFGVDGCSIPAPCLPLINLAKGFREFINFESQPNCQKIFNAFVSHPILTCGTQTYCSEVMVETKGRVLVKAGAEGVMIAAIPDLKTSIALKSQDGSTRASELAMSLLLQKLNILSDKSELLKPKIKNWNGIETGFVSCESSIYI